jgi:hypothetical protein
MCTYITCIWKMEIGKRDPKWENALGPHLPLARGPAQHNSSTASPLLPPLPSGPAGPSPSPLFTLGQKAPRPIGTAQQAQRKQHQHGPATTSPLLSHLHDGPARRIHPLPPPSATADPIPSYHLAECCLPQLPPRWCQAEPQHCRPRVQEDEDGTR